MSKRKAVSPLQMAMFPFMKEASSEDKRPLPLIVADNWQFPLQHQAQNGKTYQMDFATDESLYFITQRMDTNTGLRDKILIFLAKSGAH